MGKEANSALSVSFALALALSISAPAQAASFDPSIPAAIATQMRDDLEFIKSVQGAQVSPLHQEIYGAMTGAGYQQFFDSHITAVGFNDCGSANAVACVIPWLGKKMFITNNYIKFSHPQIARLMVVYHEARHTESNHGNWGHATCPTPFKDENGADMKSIWTGASLAGEPACDSTPYGSYGSSTIMLKNISRYCASCNEKVKMDADLYATDQLGRVNNAAAKAAIKKDVF